MLSRCKGKSAANYVRCIAIPASPSSFPRESSSKETKRNPSKKEEDEVWNSVLKSIPTSSKWQTLASQKRRNALDPHFFSSRRLGQSRKYTTDAKDAASSAVSPEEPGSLFDPSKSAWDHVFRDLEDLPPLASAPVQSRPRSTVYNPPGIVSARRQSMTAREIEAFNSMFNMIFSAVQKSEKKDGAESKTGSTGPPRTAADRRADKAARYDPLSGVGIGSGPEGTSSVVDLFGKLRRVSRKFRWSPAEDAELERKLAQIELCDTDHQLLEWAVKEVFEESARYEEAARQAVVRAESRTKAAPEPDSKAAPEPNSESSVAEPTAPPSPDSNHAPTPSFSSPLPLQPPAYPHLLAALMRTFRDKFHDPHLALSIFTHARSRSIASFVFGCTAPAYNELLRTRWSAFHDLRGVVDALSEMRVNGIAPDARTRELVEEVRREVGARTVWQEERNIGTGEVLQLLTRIETLSREPKQDKQQRNKRPGNGSKKMNRWRTSTAERWKTGSGSGFDKNYRFGDWNFDKPSRNKSSNHTSQPSPTPELDQFAFE